MSRVASWRRDASCSKNARRLVPQAHEAIVQLIEPRADRGFPSVGDRLPSRRQREGPALAGPSHCLAHAKRMGPAANTRQSRHRPLHAGLSLPVSPADGLGRAGNDGR